DREAAGSAAVAGRRQGDEGSWRHSAHDAPDGGVSQVPDDGSAGRQKQRRAGQVRRQEPHRGCVGGAGGSCKPLLTNRLPPRTVSTASSRSIPALVFKT